MVACDRDASADAKGDSILTREPPPLAAPHLRRFLLGLALGALLLSGIIELAGRYLYVVFHAGYGITGSLSLLALIVACVPSIYVFRQLHTQAWIVRTITAGVFLCILSQAVSLADFLPVPLAGSFAQALNDTIALEDVLLIAGLFFLCGGFYLSIFYSAIVLERMAEDRARLAEEVDEHRRTEQALRDSEDALWAAKEATEDRVRERTSKLAETNRRLEDEILERRRAETALRQSEQWYRSLAEATHEVIYIVARDDTVLYVNSEAGRQLGLSPDGIVGRKRTEFFSGDIERGQGASLARVFESGEPIRLEHPTNFHGQPAWQDTFLVPLRDESGAAVAVMGVSRDITVRKTAETALHERLAMEELVSRLTARFVGAVPESMDREIHHGLQVIGVFMKVERASLVYYDADISKIVRVDEWCAPGIRVQADDLVGIDMASMQWTIDHLRQGSIVVVDSVSALPPDAQAEREHCARRGLRAALGLPLRSGKRLHGYLGVSMYTAGRHWTEGEIRLLHFIASVFVSALDRVQARSFLEANERKYRTLLENLSDAVYRVRLSDGVCEYISPSALDVFGYPAQQFMETPFFLARIIHPDFRAAFDEHWNEAVQGHATATHKYKIVDPEGNDRWIFQSGTIIADENGKPGAAEGVCRNITSEHAAQRLLEKQRAKLIESQKMSILGEMAANIAHEINNPLAIVSGSAEQIREAVQGGLLSPEIGEHLSDTIMRNATRIKTIIKGLRNFTRDGAADPFRETRLRAVIDDTESICRERFLSYDVQLQVEPVPDTLFIECRPTQIMEVLVNLLSNALHAVEHADEQWVSLGVHDIGDDIEIVVADSGPGIPPDVERLLFERFGTTKEFGKGTGLGLSISKRIVQSHGGNLSYDRLSGHTRFTIRLPKKHVDSSV